MLALLGNLFLIHCRLIQQQGALVHRLIPHELTVFLTDYLAYMHTLDALDLLRAINHFVLSLPHAFGGHLLVVVKVCRTVLGWVVVASQTSLISRRFQDRTLQL